MTRMSVFFVSDGRPCGQTRPRHLPRTSHKEFLRRMWFYFFVYAKEESGSAGLPKWCQVRGRKLPERGPHAACRFVFGALSAILVSIFSVCVFVCVCVCVCHASVFLFLI